MEATTKRNLLIWGVLLLVILNVSSLGTIWYHRYQFKNDRRDRGFAEKQMWQGKEKAMHRNSRGRHVISSGLNLTAEQQIQFDSIWHYYNERRESIESGLGINRTKMGAIMSSSKVDTAAYYSLSGLQLSLISDLDKAMINMNLAIRETLSEDQTNLFLKKIESLNKGQAHHRSGDAKRKKLNKNEQ